MDLGLKGKYALVTGGSHGIGRAIALALADEGCNVAICARGLDKINEVVEELEERGVQALGLQCNAQYKMAILNTLDTIYERWDALHILVNNVGGGGRWGFREAEKTPEAIWRDVYEKNAMAAVRFTMGTIPQMFKQRWGRVVSISSIYGREGGGRPWFSMAKGAEISLMKSLAMDHQLARANITFNSVAPGAIMIQDTEWETEQRRDPARFEKTLHFNYPLGRLGTPEEVASAVVFLCSGKASLINGACLAIDGGEGKSL